MKYDFETLIDRRNTGAEKWDVMKDICDKDIAPLSVADVDIKLAPEIRQGLIEFLSNDPVLGYTVGNDAYFNSIISWMDKNYGYKVEREWIVPSSGIVPALNDAVAAYSKEDEGVIIFTPVYPPFFKSIKNSRREMVRCPLLHSDIYEIDFDSFEQLAKAPKNTLLILCSPHNPIGRVWTKEELTRLGSICLENGVTIVSDEIHQDLTMPGFTHYPIASISDELADITVTCTAPSKSFNIAGLQASNIIIKNEALRKKFIDAQAKKGFFSLNTLAFEATRLAYTKAAPWLEEFKALIKHNFDLLDNYIKAKLPKVKVTPLQGTYLAWVDCRAYGYSNEELENRMLSNKLFLDEGYLFGDEGSGFERISVACPSHVLAAALDRFAKALEC